jgi:hypothetical protein
MRSPLGSSNSHCRVNNLLTSQIIGTFAKWYGQPGAELLRPRKSRHRLDQMRPSVAHHFDALYSKRRRQSTLGTLLDS